MHTLDHFRKATLLLPVVLMISACCGGGSDKAAQGKGGHGKEGSGAPPGAKFIGPGNVPDVPDSRSAPPSVDEWKGAAEVNTVGANSAPHGCSMHVVREWLKVNCSSGDITKVSDMEGFGGKGSDYFEWLSTPKVADYVVRMRKGTAQKIRIWREKDKVSLFVNWPGGASKPSIIALQSNPLLWPRALRSSQAWSRRRLFWPRALRSSQAWSRRRGLRRAFLQLDSRAGVACATGSGPERRWASSRTWLALRARGLNDRGRADSPEARKPSPSLTRRRRRRGRGMRTRGLNVRSVERPSSVADQHQLQREHPCRSSTRSSPSRRASRASRFPS